jgi:hypothetical protein
VGKSFTTNTTDFSDLTRMYNNIFLKIDIEGGEYDWLLGQSVAQLLKFKQIVIELHGLTGDGFGHSYDNKIKCLEKLSNTHYIVHAHGNNCGSVINQFPDVLELTYVRKTDFKEVPSKHSVSFPIPGLDFKNCQNKPEIILNYYPFVNGNTNVSPLTANHNDNNISPFNLLSINTMRYTYYSTPL